MAGLIGTQRRRRVPVRAALVVAATLLLQITLVSDLRIAGSMGDLVLVLVVAAGITGGADRGALYGFVTGVLFDLLVETPFGLTALTYMLVGYAVGVVAVALQRTGGWWAVGMGAVAGAVQAVLYTALGNLIGVDYSFGAVPGIALAMAVVAAVLVVPFTRALWWVHGAPEADRLAVVLR
jgi:rod shape-determining protein MreD